MWWKRAKNGRKLVKLGENHIPNVKEASKYPLSNNNNAHSITKYGVLGRLDIQIVALRLVHPIGGARVKNDARRVPGALTLTPNVVEVKKYRSSPTQMHNSIFHFVTVPPHEGEQSRHWGGGYNGGA